MSANLSRSRRFSRGLVLLLALCSGRSVEALGIQPIVLDGDPAAGIPDGTYRFFYEVSINDSGEIAFMASVDAEPNRAGVFVESGAGVRAIALEGDAAPDAGGGVFSGFDGGEISNSGEVAFLASVNGATTTRGIFVWSEGVLASIASRRGNAPGTNGGVFGGGFGLPAIDASGAVVFTVDVNAGDFPSGVFSYADGVISPIALEGAPAPGVAGGVYGRFVGDPSTNGVGDVAFVSIVESGTEIQYVVYVHSGGSTSVAAMGGDVPNGAGGAAYYGFDGIGPVAITDTGDIYFTARLVTPGSTPVGIFVDSPGAVGEALILQDAIAPGTAGGTFVPPDANPSANEAAMAVFHAQVSGGSSSAGVFMNAGGTTSAIAVEGGPAPGTGGGSFEYFDWRPDINRAGSVVFHASVRDGSATDGIFLLPEPRPLLGSLFALGCVGLVAAVRLRGLDAGGASSPR